MQQERSFVVSLRFYSENKKKSQLIPANKLTLWNKDKLQALLAPVEKLVEKRRCVKMRKYIYTQNLVFCKLESTLRKTSISFAKIKHSCYPLRMTNLGPDMGAIVGPTNPDDIFQPGERGGQGGSQVITLNIHNLDKFE